MPGIFHAGQLVKTNDLISLRESVPLYSVPGGTTDVRTLGRLFPNDIALVITTMNSSVSVYVVGPNGSGWTFGAMIKRL